MAGPSSSNPWFAKDSKSRSFKEVVEGASGVKIDFVHSTVKGLPALLFEDSVVSKLATPFSFTLVGKFMLKRPNIDTIRKFFVNLKLSGTFSVGLMDQRHIAIQLSNDLDYSRIFARRDYYILGCQMRLLKWSPDFDVREESPIVPVWISFPNLRLHFFNHQVLFALASIFGRPLQTDQATSAISHPSVARVLVELDVTKKHPREVWLGSEFNGYFQRVEFENLPIFCVHCKMHGHSMAECFILHPSRRKHKENVQSSEGINVVANNIPEGANDAGENQNVHHVAEDTSRPVGNGDEFSGTHAESVEGLQGNKEIVDEQMLAVLKPVDASLKANCSENNFDRICCSENAIDNVDLQDRTVIRDLEEGELAGSPNLSDNPKAAPREQTQNEHDSSGMINSICRQNIVELTNCDEALQNNKTIELKVILIRLWIPTGIILREMRISQTRPVKWQMEPLINWNIGNANVFFWQDNWVDNLSIDRLLNTMSKDTCKVKDFITNDSWNLNKLSVLIPELIIQKIINIPFNLGNEDKLNFTLTNNNCFNAKKVWNYFRTKFPTNKVFSMVWHRNIPSTVSVFVWRLLHKFVPADDMLIDKGISVVSKCQCCFHVENINHIFVSGPVAVKLWYSVGFVVLVKLSGTDLGYGRVFVAPGGGLLVVGCDGGVGE
ncbi:hypothetical protein M5K25_002329 [Dendrobium thyrsiflorum]|uniref:DUF4283 domain-containing protein n=1 Tax=Dendrobium thyrsiflorum TaxID=117978 RepID=A0ABD0VSB5_DENTH